MTTDSRTVRPALPRRATISNDVLFQEVEGQAVLLDLGREYYFSLDDVGTRIWSLLVEQAEVSTVVERMCELYDVDEAALRLDLALFLARLASAGLVHTDA
ncbi:MAG TPA: PqqD family protein [Longimicrobiaceae bacterium]|jgi:hypothetical protein|nr:PqqD family protein [Longimicrobiaceae bacterium]